MYISLESTNQRSLRGNLQRTCP